MRSPAFTVPGRPAEGDQPNSPAFFLPASSFSASNAQSATSHFFPSRGREGGWQKYEATGVFWNKSVFSYRSVVTKNDRKSDVRSFRDRLFREKHCGPRGSRASSHRWQSAWLCASKKPAPRITLDAAHAPRDARIDSSFAPRTPPTSPPTAAGRVSPRRASPARRTPRADVLAPSGTFWTRHASRFHLMGRNATGFYGRDILSTTIKVQCNAHHSDTGRGSSSIAEGALPYDVVHLAGGGRA